MALTVDVFQCLDDNFGFLIHDEASGATASIDAPDADPIRAAINRRGWTLTDILITHHHPDHTQGIPVLKSQFTAKVTGPRAEKDKIPGLDILVAGGDTIFLGETALNIYDTPGHTLGHIVYHDSFGHHLFSGDALFSLGCGRMFEGAPGPMWDGLASLRTLPDETRIYCGHEYTAANAGFAISIDPDNKALKQRIEEIQTQRAQNIPTIPVTMGSEKAQNPFLRADNSALAANMGLPDAPPQKVFAAMRKAKDNFKVPNV